MEGELTLYTYLIARDESTSNQWEPWPYIFGFVKQQYYILILNNFKDTFNFTIY